MTVSGQKPMALDTPDGAIRRRCWKEPQRLLAWAEQYGIEVTDAVIEGV